jgi:hypothetical protein
MKAAHVMTAASNMDTNRHLVEAPDSSRLSPVLTVTGLSPFFDGLPIARWPRDADVRTIARCILGTLKHEPHTCDLTALRLALKGVIESA